MNTSPNILFIFSDQHNAKILGHKGHPDVKTPHLDRMAAEGVSFDNAITQSPICTPSRVSWLSGQYCHNHGYYGLSGPNPNGLPTLFSHFKANGYRSAAIGKSHGPENWIENGCDVFFDPSGNCAGGRSKEYADYLNERGLTDLEDQGIMREFGEKGRQSVDARPSTIAFADGQEGWSVKKMIEFMDQSVKDDTPFVAQISFPKPHQCYTPAKEFWDLYDESSLSLPPNADYSMEGKSPHLQQTASSWKARQWQLFEPKTFEAGRLRKLHGYLGNVSHVDHAVGELLTWLDTNNLSENTIVIYSSDHGEYVCEHGIMEKSPGICSDAVTRIPLIWRWSGEFKKGHVAEDIVEAVDLINTLCSLTGIDAMETSDGHDISSFLYGNKGGEDRIGITENVWSKSIRKGPYRLVYYPKDMFLEEYPLGFGELYHLKDDPWEMKNLFFESHYSEVVRELKDELFDWLVTTTRPATIQPGVTKVTNQSKIYYHNAVNADGKVNTAWVKNMTNKNYK